MKTFITALVILSMVLVFGCSNEAENSDNPQPVNQFEQNNETEPVPEGEIGQDEPTEQDEPVEEADPVGLDEPGEADIVETPGTFEGLSAELEMRILRDFINLKYPWYFDGPPDRRIAFLENSGVWITAYDYVKGIRVWNYFGTYNGCVAVMLNGSGYQMVTTRVIGGVEYVFRDTEQIYLWKEGLFFVLAEAYDLGLLTQANVQSIYNSYGENLRSQRILVRQLPPPPPSFTL